MVQSTYRKVTSKRLSRLVAHSRIFRRLMKGNFDSYVEWPLDKMVQNWIIDWSTARNSTVCFKRDTTVDTVVYNTENCRDIIKELSIASSRNLGLIYFFSKVTAIRYITQGSTASQWSICIFLFLADNYAGVTVFSWNSDIFWHLIFSGYKLLSFI